MSSIAPSLLSPGSTFAGCRLEAVAGRGGMGVVYRARQLALQRRVALKAIAPEFAGDDDYRERFEREAHLAASIEHPNVVPIYEAGDLDGTLYLIMRWVDGTDLRTRLTQCERLSPASAIRLLRPIASALTAAHRRGLIHRDVKPANVLIARDDEEHEEHIYLSDFGVARRDDGGSITRTGTVVGTIDYTAPERIVGGDGDARSDIYSFGCMLFEALTGHVPFERPTEYAKTLAHVNDPIPSARDEIDEVSEQLDAIVAKAMAKDPDERFGSAGQLSVDLGRALDKLDGAARPTATPNRRRTIADVESPVAHPTLAVTEPATAVTDAAAVPKRRRSAALGVASIALLSVLAAVLAASLSGSGGAPGKLDAKADRATGARAIQMKIHGSGIAEGRTVDVSSAAGSISIGSRNVWISLPRKGELVRVDLLTGRRRIFTAPGGPTALAAGFAALWVAEPAFRSLVQFNGDSGRPVSVTALPGTPTAIALDQQDSSAWVADSSGSISHVALGGAVRGTPAYGGAPATSLAWGEGSLWAANATDDGLVRLGLGSSGASTTHAAGPHSVAVALDRGVWIAHANGDLARVEPRRGQLRVDAHIALAPGLDAVAATDPSPFVWAISRNTDTLYRIANTRHPTITGTVVFASAPVALATSAHSVWIATQDGKVTQVRF